MALSFKFASNAAEWKASIREKQKPVAEAGIAALREVAAMSVQEGRKDIGAAGPGFRRAKWQSGLGYRTKETKTEDGAPSLNAKATIFHRYGIAGVFEYGATIHGRPLMWIPTEHKGASGARFGGSSLDKERSPFLVSATINGTPVLFDKRDKSRDRKPVFIGVKQVDIPKKFHVTEITEKNFENFGALFYLHFKDET
jgi:hypothetical protein